jgi:hypothetical protein
MARGKKPALTTHASIAWAVLLNLMASHMNNKWKMKPKIKMAKLVGMLYPRGTWITVGLAYSCHCKRTTLQFEVSGENSDKNVNLASEEVSR